MDEGAFVFDYWSPGGTALAETDPHVAHRRVDLCAYARRLPARHVAPVRELGLFATEQNRGDMVVRLKPEG